MHGTASLTDSYGKKSYSQIARKRKQSANYGMFPNSYRTLTLITIPVSRKHSTKIEPLATTGTGYANISHCATVRMTRRIENR
jgi:hypothetical protein